MTDVLELLREVNPEQAESLELPVSLRGQQIKQITTGSSRPKRRLALTAASVLSCAAAVAVVFLVMSGGPNLAARAYAASDGPGVAHWVVTIDAYTDGSTTTHQTDEGWTDGKTTRDLLTSNGGSENSVTERQVRAGIERTRVNGGPISDGPASSTDLQRSLPGGDPFEAFRIAYRAGRLDRVSDTRFAVKDGAVTLVYDLDPSDATPRTLTETTAESQGQGGHTTKIVTRFERYELLPLTSDNLAHLQLQASGN
jgi:hypothetical protein